MNYNRISTTLTKYIPLFLLVFALAATTSCDTIIGQINELPEEQDDEASNENDPGCKCFRMPDLVLNNGQFSFDDPFTITERNLNLSWQLVNSSGETITSNSGYTFQYRYAHSSEDISNDAYVDLGSEQTLQISNLRETFNTEVYNFEILATYTTESVTRDTTFSGQFFVDAFQSRGFLFNPDVARQTDGTYIVEVYLDEIQNTDDLTAFSLSIDFNSNVLSVGEGSVVITDDQGSFLYRDGAEIISFVELSNNNLTLDLGVAGSGLEPYSGGGKICEIYMTPSQSFSSTTISVSSASVLKTSDGTELQIGEYDSILLTQ